MKIIAIAIFTLIGIVCLIQSLFKKKGADSVSVYHYKDHNAEWSHQNKLRDVFVLLAISGVSFIISLLIWVL